MSWLLSGGLLAAARVRVTGAAAGKARPRFSLADRVFLGRPAAPAPTRCAWNRPHLPQTGSSAAVMGRDLGMPT